MKRIACLLILVAAVLGACTSTKWVRTAVVKEYDFAVALEQRQGNDTVAQQKYEHPRDIDLADLEKLMRDLTYTEKGGMISKSKQSPVFQQVEIDRLAPVLADSLAKADASQQVRFISFNQGQAVLFSTSQKTEGVVFVESGGRLNLAFNYINANRIPSETSAIYSNYSAVNPLKIEDSDTTLSASAPYAELRTLDTGKQAPMWVVADLGKLKEASRAVAAPVAKSTENLSPAVAPKAETTVTPVVKTAPAPAQQEDLKRDIKNTLKYLKELLDEGLISENDYNAKKAELLDKID